MVKIYHNPRCSKSRNALSLITESGQAIEVIEYLKTPLTKETIEDIVEKLGVHPLEIIRKNESVFKEKYKNQDLNVDQWIDVIVQEPILLERPVVVFNEKAVIARPPELVKEIL